MRIKEFLMDANIPPRPQAHNRPYFAYRRFLPLAARLRSILVLIIFFLAMFAAPAGYGGNPSLHTALASPQAAQIDLVGPPGSSRFGTSVTVLPNGNLVITDPFYSAGGIEWIGAVYLYDRATGALISMLTGSTALDQVGSGSVTALPNGNFVIYSKLWDYASAQAGAVTWCSGTAGCSGVVSPDNSLVGPGFEGTSEVNVVTPLANGNYVVNCTFCDVGGVADVGAITWGDGTTGVAGFITAANSLVGSTAGDGIGNRGVKPLPNGNYVVQSYSWMNGTVYQAGAVTWCDGSSGCTGAVSPSNSLVGSTANDMIGNSAEVLPNGNYVVLSMVWDNGGAADAGAATWCSAAAGCTGPVSEANSLVGNNTGDNVGYYGVVALTNGNFVVRSHNWENYMIAEHAGAVTWCSGTMGCSGVVSPSNSLVGDWTDDYVGRGGVTPLPNGDYVVQSPNWELLHEVGIYNFNQGASTWCNGTTGCVGGISESNSLVGSQPYDGVGGRTAVLANGNYLVVSPIWNYGSSTRAGAVTWCPGTGGCAGEVAPENSLVGEHAYDYVGDSGITALANGNYVVSSPVWDNGAVPDAGAVTWGDGDAPLAGLVSAANSLVGSSSSDMIGKWINELSSGHYVVSSPFWDHGGASDAGAATWCDGSSGCSGPITASNSLVGGQVNDRIAGNSAVPLTNGNYVVSSAEWDNGVVADVGAITWADGDTGIVGYVTPGNSLVGSTANDWLGSGALIALSNGNYVVGSPYWDNGAVTNAGAVTWADGATGLVGTVSAANSLVGSTVNDYLCWGSYTVLDDGKFIVRSSYWDNGAIPDAGAVTLASGSEPITGPITSANSVMGTYGFSGESLFYLYHTTYDYLIVSRYYENIVTIFPALPDEEPPLPPTLLSPSDGGTISDTTPTLTWQASASPDVAGYLLDFNGTVVDVGSVTQYTTAELENDDYTWAVAAYDISGNTGAYTNTWSFTLDQSAGFQVFINLILKLVGP
jgi:hypothetical protein